MALTAKLLPPRIFLYDVTAIKAEYVTVTLKQIFLDPNLMHTF